MICNTQPGNLLGSEHRHCSGHAKAQLVTPPTLAFSAEAVQTEQASSQWATYPATYWGPLTGPTPPPLVLLKESKAWTHMLHVCSCKIWFFLHTLFVVNISSNKNLDWSDVTFPKSSFCHQDSEVNKNYWSEWGPKSQKPRQRVSNHDRKVFANPESFCDKFIIGWRISGYFAIQNIQIICNESGWTGKFPDNLKSVRII